MKVLQFPCIDCNRKPAPGASRCSYHLKKAAERQAEYRKRLEVDTCWCGNSAKVNGLCAEHHRGYLDIRGAA